MHINPDIFKAYDVRGLYPTEINEDVAPLIGRGLAAYLRVPSIGVSRDMRLSSPALAAAFIDGVRSQGTDVIDYGMMGTDMLLLRRGPRRSCGRRADHRVAQSRSSTTASRWSVPRRCRSAATPASATSAT